MILDCCKKTVECFCETSNDIFVFLIVVIFAIVLILFLDFFVKDFF